MTLWVLALLACGRSVDCSSPEQVLVEHGERALTCHEATWAVDYVELLAGRAVPKADRRIALGEVVDRFEDDPVATETWLEQVRSGGWELTSLQGLKGAEARATRVWAAQAGQDVIDKNHGDLWNVQKRALSVWSVADDDQLALTESDIEAWIRYASLCREVQQGGVLRISVADRVSVYRMAQERFEHGTRPDRVAMTAFGAYWQQITDAWQAASYERQQAWIAAAPLPPPMTATSLGYAGAIFEGDVGLHAKVVQDKLGPFILGARKPMFRQEEASE